MTHTDTYKYTYVLTYSWKHLPFSSNLNRWICKCVLYTFVYRYEHVYMYVWLHAIYLQSVSQSVNVDYTMIILKIFRILYNLRSTLPHMHLNQDSFQKHCRIWSLFWNRKCDNKTDNIKISYMHIFIKNFNTYQWFLIGQWGTCLHLTHRKIVGKATNPIKILSPAEVRCAKQRSQTFTNTHST